MNNFNHNNVDDWFYHSTTKSDYNVFKLFARNVVRVCVPTLPRRIEIPCACPTVFLLLIISFSCREALSKLWNGDIKNKGPCPWLLCDLLRLFEPPHSSPAPFQQLSAGSASRTSHPQAIIYDEAAVPRREGATGRRVRRSTPIQGAAFIVRAGNANAPKHNKKYWKNIFKRR